MSAKQGSDEAGDGTEQKPFKTPLRVSSEPTVLPCLVFVKQYVGHACVTSKYFLIGLVFSLNLNDYFSSY